MSYFVTKCVNKWFSIFRFFCTNCLSKFYVVNLKPLNIFNLKSLKEKFWSNSVCWCITRHYVAPILSLHIRPTHLTKILLAIGKLVLQEWFIHFHLLLECDVDFIAVIAKPNFFPVFVVDSSDNFLTTVFTENFTTKSTMVPSIENKLKFFVTVRASKSLIIGDPVAWLVLSKFWTYFLHLL